MITFSEALFPSRVLDDAAKLIVSSDHQDEQNESLTSLAWCRWCFHPFKVPLLVFL